jgi:4-hydroxybenzoate polyprenyltransferase
MLLAENPSARSRGPEPVSAKSIPSWMVSWVRLIRPTHWLKNSFVFAPLLFTKSAHNWVSLGQELIVFAAFCLLASAVYCINDVLDAELDRAHPRKKHRPVACGVISSQSATALGIVLGLLGLALAGSLNRSVLIVSSLYLANSLMYCIWFKHHVLVDVLAIAVGFVLRLLGGCAAIAVEPSSWLLVCGFSVALFLGFGKRRAELASLGEAEQFRGVLGVYTIPKLDTVLAITCAISLLSYMLYAISPETIARHGTKNLIYSSVFVIYGLFRYLFKVQEGKGDGPTGILTSDWVFPVNGILWGVTVYVILKWGSN